jgi:hypothetical protein
MGNLWYTLWFTAKLVLIDRDVRARDNGLYDALTILTLPSTRCVERGNGLVEWEPAYFSIQERLYEQEHKPMGDKRLEVDLALGDKSNGKRVISRLRNLGETQCKRDTDKGSPHNGTSLCKPALSPVHELSMESSDNVIFRTISMPRLTVTFGFPMPTYLNKYNCPEREMRIRTWTKVPPDLTTWNAV